MNAFWGADADALRTLGAVCARRSELLADLESRLSATIDGVEWVGEDAERFRADWTGLVRPALLDGGVELRHHARRLQQHADEQDAASSPGGLGGGWSGAGTFPQDVAQRIREAIRDLRGSAVVDEGTPGGPLRQLLGEVLGTAEGRAAFLGSFLGSLGGGLLAEMIGRALEAGTDPRELLAGPGLGGGLSALIGEGGQVGPAGEPGTADAARPLGVQGTAAGAEQSAGSTWAGRIEVAADASPQSPLERLLELLGDAIAPGDGGASLIGEDIGRAGVGPRA